MEFNSVIQETIPFLMRVPNYMPHIGKNYGTANQKIIIVGESHYLVKSLNNKVSREDWYDDLDTTLQKIDDAQSMNYIHTRSVIQDMLIGKFNKAYTIFYNLNKEYQDVFTTTSHLFEDAAYLNFFQRPAEQMGESINNNTRDNQVAYENLIKLGTMLQPDMVIFVSSKSCEAFKSEEHKQRKANFKYDAVPHAASAWWNKSSSNYGVNRDGSKRTGREKFRAVLKESNNSL